MFHSVNFYRIPTFLFYIFKSPSLLIHCIYYLIKKKNIHEYMDDLRYINEIRMVCCSHGEMDKKGNWNIKCDYKKIKNGMKVRVRFKKKGTDVVYDNFKEEISKFTLPTTEYEFKKGWANFAIVAPVAVKEIVNDYHSICIGTGVNGFVMWDFDVYSCCLIAGKPRNGKTVEVIYMLNGLLKANYDVWLIDGKVVDYALERDKFKEYVQNKDLKKVCEFINKFHNDMEDRYLKMEQLQVNNYRKTEMQPVFLVCDEYLSVIDRAKKELKKADYENLISLLGDIIRRGPACGFQIILTMQRADTTYIVGEMRDNIQLKIVLGDGGEELYKMMFNEKLNSLNIGKAWYRQGNDLGVLAVPFYENIESFEEVKNETIESI